MTWLWHEPAPDKYQNNQDCHEEENGANNCNGPHVNLLPHLLLLGATLRSLSVAHKGFDAGRQRFSGLREGRYLA